MLLVRSLAYSHSAPRLESIERHYQIDAILNCHEPFAAAILLTSIEKMAYLLRRLSEGVAIAIEVLTLIGLSLRLLKTAINGSNG